MVHHWVSIFINCKARFLLLCNSKVDSPVDRPGPSNGCGELGPSNGHFFGKGLWLPGRSGKVRSVNIDWISRLGGICQGRHLQGGRHNHVLRLLETERLLLWPLSIAASAAPTGLRCT